jgi:hypothetical protein
MKENLLPISRAAVREMIGYHENHNTVSELNYTRAYVRAYYIQSFYASLIVFAVICTHVFQVHILRLNFSSHYAYYRIGFTYKTGRTSCNVMDEAI